MKTIKKLLTKTNLLVFLIILVAAFMRLYKIADYLTFLGDEGRDVLVVYNILHGHLTLLGPTASVGGFFLGPIYYYFMAPALWLAGYSPVGPAVMIALFGVATVWLVYYVGKRFFNITTGIIAALLYAIAPVVILYSRSSWNPNLMPITTLLLMFALYKAVEKNKALLFGLAGFLFGIAMQLHYIEVFIGVTVGLYILFSQIYLFINQKNKSFLKLIIQLIKDFLIFGVGFIIGWSPFLAFEMRHGFNNIRAILNFVFHPQSTGNGVGLENNTFMTMENVFFRLFGRLVINIPSSELYKSYSVWQIQLWIISSWVLGLGSLILLIWEMIKNKKNTEKFMQYMLLILWLLVGVFLFGFYKKNIYDYYFEFLFPVPFLLIGNLFAVLFTKKRLVQVLTLFTLTIIIIINLQGIPFRYPGNRQLQQTEIISQFVLDKTNGQPFNFALITGGNSDHAYRYFFTVWGHEPVTIQYPGVDPKRTSVTDQLMVVCEDIPCQPLGNSLWEIAGFGRADITGHWHVSVVDVYRLLHYKETSKSQTPSFK